MRKKFKARKSQSLRSSEAFSLVTVTIVGLLATMWITATTSSMLQIYQSTNQSKYSSALLSSAESAIDFVVANLNDPSTRGTYDASSTYKSQKVTTLDGTAWGAPNDATIKVYVQNIAPTYNSYLYDGSISPIAEQPPKSAQSSPANWSIFKQNASAQNFNNWRLVTAIASYGSVSKSVVVALRPVYTAQKLSNSTTTGPSNYFPTGATATGVLEFGSNTTTDAYDSSSGSGSTIKGLSSADGKYHNLGGDISAYNVATLTGSVSIGGELNVPSLDRFAQSANNPDSQALVSRAVTTSGTAPGFMNSNVYGAFNASQNMPILPGPSISTQSSIPQTPLPSAPTAPVTANGQLDSSVVTALTNAATVTQPNTTTIMPPGDYYASSLTVAKSGTLKLESPTSNVPVRLFIDGSNGASGTSNVVQLIGNVNENGSAANFQIWYNGTGTIEVRSPVVKASIYAPNATVLLGSNQNTDLNAVKGNSPSSFSGAIVARTIRGGTDKNNNLVPTKNLSLHIDRALLKANSNTNGSGEGEDSDGGMSSAQSASLTYNPSTYTSPPKTFQVISYMESRASH